MDAKSLFLESFYAERAKYGDTPSHQIRGAGKPTKARPRGEDELWWMAEGPKMVQRWIDWRAANPDWQIWIAPDGQPGIELAIMPLFAGVGVKMIVDRVFLSPAGKIVVVDLKSGARSQTSDLQLGFYAAGIQKTYGVEVRSGAYWDARKGELSPVQNVSRITPGLMSVWIARFEWARANNIYLPNVSEKCRSCSMSRYCAAYGGSESHLDPDSQFGQEEAPLD